ncbi:MAG: SLBB domain-containing protein, partial [Bacteroidota bacterium]
MRGTENLRQLIEFAGGLTVDAYHKEVQVKRIVNDEEKIIDVPMKSLFDAGEDFVLLTGDIVTIKSIPKTYENFVEIIGAVELPGKYALTEKMRISDLIVKGQLEKKARKDFAYLYRKNYDGTNSISRVDLKLILENPNQPKNLLLKSQDRLITFQKSRFIDSLTVSITGAVREPAIYPYDPSESLTVEDLIFLSGGILPNATDFAYIKRRSSDNSKDVEYISVNLIDAINNPLDAAKNIVLRPFDEIKVLAKETYTDDFTVTIDGAVRNPGEFIYGESMTMRDLLTLAGGLKFGASFSRIDVFRLRIRDNQPTQTIVAQIAV